MRGTWCDDREIRVRGRAGGRRMMDPDRFRVVDALFDGALLIPVAERRTWLEQGSVHDPSLVTEVLELLESVEASESMFGENVAEFAGPLIQSMDPLEDHAEPPLGPGEILGPWRILRDLGRGGMGEVYLAERADDAFELRVAVKIVKRGMDTAEVLRRFREERKMLASLNHPNIARVLDGGATADGRPYLVLEYVEGAPIDRWCKERGMGLRDTVTLFRQVCEAVDHAHRRLIVHRDVKPNNVLVTDDGVPKLLDFGIAKLLEADASVTRTGVRLLTPLYAAPEQEAGLPITTVTDVFSLGRLLRLLVDEAGEGGPRGREGLRRELETIIQRATAHDPERRYGSALQLSEDLGRWLEGRPVLARPDSLGYRIGKLVRRNRIVVGAGALSVGLVLGSVVLLWAAQRSTAAALIQAQEQRDTAEEVVSVLQGIFSAGDPMTTRRERLDTLRAAALLQRGTERVRTELAGQPVVQARLLRTLGETHRGLGLLESADTLLREAVTLQRTLDAPVALSEALNALAVLDLQKGGGAEAEALLREALDLAGREEGEGRVGMLVNLASALQNEGRFDEADEAYREAETRILAASVLDSVRLGGLFSARGALAERMGDRELSREMLERTLELDRALLGVDHWRVGLAMVNLAFSRQREERLEESDSLYVAGVEILREGLGPEHPLHFNAMAALANVRGRRGEAAEAHALYDRAIPGLRRVEGATPNLSVVLNQYGSLLQQEGDVSGAEAAYRESVSIEQATRGPGHPAVGVSKALLAGFLCESGNSEEGRVRYEEALQVLEVAFPPEHPRVTDARDGLERCGTGADAA